MAANDWKVDVSALHKNDFENLRALYPDLIIEMHAPSARALK